MVLDGEVPQAVPKCYFIADVFHHVCMSGRFEDRCQEVYQIGALEFLKKSARARIKFELKNW